MAGLSGRRARNLTGSASSEKRGGSRLMVWLLSLTMVAVLLGSGWGIYHFFIETDDVPATVSGFKRAIDDTDWIITRVAHNLNESGYTTSLELEIKATEVGD